MRSFWKRDRDEIDARLRAIRPVATSELVDELKAHLRHAEHRQVRGFSRLAFAGAVVTLVIGAFASFGGVSYAASSARQSVRAVTRVTSGHATAPRTVFSAAVAQYETEKTVGAPLGKKATKASPAAPFVPPQNVPTKGTLPFTGLSLAGTLAVALLLIALGLVLRRRERRDS